jgi:DNA-binding GntR family transcriptional regulator
MENSMEPRSSKSRSLTTKVGARIRRAIVDAEFGLGEILSEEKLAAAFGISRTPVRATRSPRCKPRD